LCVLPSAHDTLRCTARCASARMRSHVCVSVSSEASRSLRLRARMHRERSRKSIHCMRGRMHASTM
jgi:hypothetical protein